MIHMLRFLRLAGRGLQTLVWQHTRPLIGSVILTDRCNLHCRHCAVSNLVSQDYPFEQIQADLQALFDRGCRILFLYGGEPMLWTDGEHAFPDVVQLARQMGYWLVNLADIETVAELARSLTGVLAVSYNFHTPYPGTESLSLSRVEKLSASRRIATLIDQGYPVLNLRHALPFIARNEAPVPSHQCLVAENGQIWTCGRCRDIPGLCQQCGFFFAAEYSLVFAGHPWVLLDLFKAYGYLLKKVSSC